MLSFKISTIVLNLDAEFPSAQTPMMNCKSNRIGNIYSMGRRRASVEVEVEAEAEVRKLARWASFGNRMKTTLGRTKIIVPSMGS
jgi:hypothetical protein